MKNFKRNSRFGGKGKSGGFSERNSGRPEMYRAVCSECRQDCEVPFKPTGDKPVFCSNCFRNKGNREFKGLRRNDSVRFGGGEKRMFQAVCDKCGQDCEVPFRPTGDKPVYCSLCFDRGGSDRGGFDKGGREKGSNETSKQFEIVNAKLDKIIYAINSVNAVKSDKNLAVVKNEAIEKPKKTVKNKTISKALPKKVKGKKKK